MDPSINTSYSLEQKISFSISKDYCLQQLQSNSFQLSNNSGSINPDNSLPSNNFQLSNNSVSINPDKSLPSNNFQLSNNTMQNSNLNKTNKDHQQSDSVINSSLSGINNLQIIDNFKIDGNKSKQKQELSLGSNCENNQSLGNTLNQNLNQNSSFQNPKLIKSDQQTNNFQQHQQKQQMNKNKSNSLKQIIQYNGNQEISQIHQKQSQNIYDSKQQLIPVFGSKQITSSLQNQSDSDFNQFNKLKIKNQDNLALQNHLHNQNQQANSYIHNEVIDPPTKQYIKDTDLFHKLMSDNSTQIQTSKQSYNQLNTIMNSLNQSQEFSQIDFNLNLANQQSYEKDNIKQGIKKYQRAHDLMEQKNLTYTYDYVKVIIKIAATTSQFQNSEQKVFKLLQNASSNLFKISQQVSIQRTSEMYYRINLYKTRIYAKMNKLDEALHCSSLLIQLASNIFKQISVDKFGVINLRGLIHYMQHDYKQSLKYLIESYKIIKQIDGYYKQKYRVLNNIGTIYLQLQQFATASKYFLYTKQFIQQNFLTKHSQYILILCHLGYCYIKMNDNQKAKQVLLQVNQIYTNPKLNDGIQPHYVIYYSLGLLQKLRQKYQKAIQYFQQTIKIWKKGKQNSPLKFQLQVQQNIKLSKQKIQEKRQQQGHLQKINDSL